MTCTQCAAVFFSAAARPLVERGYRCPQCGGELALAPQALAPDAPEEAPVGVAAEGGSAAKARESRAGSRRFERPE